MTAATFELIKSVVAVYAMVGTMCFFAYKRERKSMIIRNKIISIHGLPGSGKTFFAAFLAWAYWHSEGAKPTEESRIYSNVDIFAKRSGRKIRISHTIRSLEDIDRIPFSETKGLVILDEGGINFNARRSSSEGNLEFVKLGMLGRKKNVDIVVISQLERMVDVYFREMSYATFEMDSWFETKDKLMFKARIYNRFGSFIVEKEMDLFKAAAICGFEYDSRDTSEIDRSGAEKKERSRPRYLDGY